MVLTYTTTPLPSPWPGTATPAGKRGKSPFGANWGGTLELLEKETRVIRAKDITLAIGIEARMIRLDGGVRADARVREPGVVLSFTTGPDRLSFPCDRFNFWQDNVRAIALALEALRKIDRYGVQSGKQYQGYKAIPTSTGGVSPHIKAHEILAAASGIVVPVQDLTIETARYAAKLARSKTHPDRNGGDDSQFHVVQDAIKIIGNQLGVTL